MYTSLVLLSLCGYFSQVTLAPSPSWQSDYSAALKVGADQKKPLAVFIGSGSEGWQKLSKDGSLDGEAKKLLQSKYVCVYVDTAKETGKKLASAFKIEDGPGLVISDRTGELQAFRYQGRLTNQDLDRCLAKYADGSRAVRETETSVTEVRQTYTSAPVSVPVQTYVPSFMGGCSSCRR